MIEPNNYSLRVWISRPIYLNSQQSPNMQDMLHPSSPCSVVHISSPLPVSFVSLECPDIQKWAAQRKRRRVSFATHSSVYTLPAQDPVVEEQDLKEKEEQFEIIKSRKRQRAEELLATSEKIRSCRRARQRAVLLLQSEQRRRQHAFDEARVYQVIEALAKPAVYDAVRKAHDLQTELIELYNYSSPSNNKRQRTS